MEGPKNVQGKFADKDIHEKCFEKISDTLFRCKLCSFEKIVKKGSGYTNKASHIARIRKDTYPSYMEGKSLLERSAFLPPKQLSALMWIDMVVSLNMPFNTVEKIKAKKYCSVKPISIKCLKKHLSLLTL